MTRRGFWLRLCAVLAAVIIVPFCVTSYFTVGMDQDWAWITRFCWGVFWGVSVRHAARRFVKKYGNTPPQKEGSDESAG